MFNKKTLSIGNLFISLVLNSKFEKIQKLIVTTLFLKKVS